MSDIRKNSLGTTQVIMATERKLRPDDFIKKIGEPKDCPFCPGNEHKTPKPELLRFNDNNGGWNLRAVPNLFPAFRIESHSNFLEHDSDSNSIADAHGAHEIIIETPNHEEDFDKIPVWRIRDLLHAITLRTDDLYKDPDIPYIAVFKNSGMGAGASLRHPHTQYRPSARPGKSPDRPVLDGTLRDPARPLHVPRRYRLGGKRRPYRPNNQKFRLLRSIRPESAV